MRYLLFTLFALVLLGISEFVVLKDITIAGIFAEPSYGPSMNITAWKYGERSDGADIFQIEFVYPSDLDVEFIPEIEALNIYSIHGEGTTLDRSQILMRYFDANSFLTLQTVQVYSTTDLTVGTEDYVARRYDIEKLPGVADFPHQPAWRNERHIVTDFRGEEGFTRYYVVAGNPELDAEVYQGVLASMTIRE